MGHGRTEAIIGEDRVRWDRFEVEPKEADQRLSLTFNRKIGYVAAAIFALYTFCRGHSFRAFLICVGVGMAYVTKLFHTRIPPSSPSQKRGNDCTMLSLSNPQINASENSEDSENKEASSLQKNEAEVFFPSSLQINASGDSEDKEAVSPQRNEEEVSPPSSPQINASENSEDSEDEEEMSLPIIPSSSSQINVSEQPAVSAQRVEEDEEEIPLPIIPSSSSQISVSEQPSVSKQRVEAMKFEWSRDKVLNKKDEEDGSIDDRWCYLRMRGNEARWDKNTLSAPEEVAKKIAVDIAITPECRVTISSGEFVNASWVSSEAAGFKGKTILTQLPINDWGTCNFWEMVAEHEVTVLVNLTNEDDKQKYSNVVDYWPEVGASKEINRRLKVTGLNPDIEGSKQITMRQFRLEYLKNGVPKKRIIRMIHFFGWKDFKGTETSALLDVINLIIEAGEKGPGMRLTHCRAGFGRTGTITTPFELISRIMRGDHVTRKDFDNFIHTMRMERNWQCLQNKDQFRVASEVMVKFVERM